MKKPSKFRVHAFLWHVLFSFVIAVLSSAWVFWVWHPAPLAKAVGVGEIFLMMLAIDVILGPILTFAVAKEGKKSLKMDLSVIVLLQVGALIYGLHSISTSRPVYLTFDVWRFEVVHANDFSSENLQKADAPYNALPWTQPEFAAVRPAANSEEKNARLFDELGGKGAPSTKAELYQSIEKSMDIIMKEASPVSELKRFNAPEAVDAVLQKHPQADQFVPLKAARVDMTVLVDSKNKQIVKVVDLRPWE